MLNESGLSTNTGISITWDEIIAVWSYKIYAKTKILTYLLFDNECGEYVEFTNDDPEFKHIIDNLDNFLALPSGWKNKIETADLKDGIIELWRKNE